MSDTFPSWRYGPNGAADIFESAADVPPGWADHPAKADDDEQPQPRPRGRPKKVKPDDAGQ